MNCNISTSKNTTKIWICEIDIFIRIRKTFTNVHKRRNPKNTRNWFIYEIFYYLFEVKVFRHEEREIQFLQQTHGTFRRPQPVSAWWPPKIIFLLLALNLNPQLTQPTRGARSAQSSLASPRSESQLLFFFKFPKSSALPRITSFTSPAKFPLWGFYYDISDCHIRLACTWTPAFNVCT